MNKTKIEWVKNPDGTQGYTWNPLTGCLNHTNGLCNGGGFPCYAYRLANGRLKERYLANNNVAPLIKQEGGQTFRMGIGLKNGFRLVKTEEAKANPFYPRFWEDRIEEMITRNDYLDGDLPRPTKRKGFFVCDMSDLFGIGVPEAWTRLVLDTIDWNKGYDRFYILTKQPQNLQKWSPFPNNCWVGVTITGSDNNITKFATLNYLKSIEAKVKYISFEPLLSSICVGYRPLWWADMFQEAGISWVIIGAQTKPYKPPKIEWVQEVVEACDRAGVPVFLKDNLDPLLGQDKRYKKWLGKDDDGNNLVGLRQEMPNA